MKGRTISDQDRKIAKKILGEGSKNISNADRARAGSMGKAGEGMGRGLSKVAKKILGEGSKNISNADRARVDELLEEAAKTISDADTLELNDGGMARKTRVF